MSYAGSLIGPDIPISMRSSVLERSCANLEIAPLAATKSQRSQLLPKMLFLIGLGLADETDITVKGLNVVKTAARVYLEAYTSILLVEKEKLVDWYLIYTSVSLYLTHQSQ